MIDLERFNQLKKKVDRLQSDRDKAQGVYEEKMQQLETAHGCKTLKQAEKKLEGMKTEQQEAEEKYRTALEQFEEEWSEVLDNQED